MLNAYALNWFVDIDLGLQSGLEAFPPKNTDQLFRGLQFLITGLVDDDEKENDGMFIRLL